MKHIIILGAVALSAVAVSTTTLAANVGTYVGLKAGWDKIATDNYSTADESFTAKDTTGVTWGFQSGYNFSPYLGVELGYDRFSTLKYDDQVGSATGTTRFSAYDLALLVKGYLPLPDNIDLMAGAGVAYVKGDYTGTVGTMGTTKPNWWRPKLAVGVDYRLDQAMTVGLSAQRVFGTGSMNKLATDGNGSDYLPSITQVLLTFDYSFGM